MSTPKSPAKEKTKARSIPYAATHHVRDHCLCLAILGAGRTVARRFDTAFRPLGMTNGQFSLLMALNRPQPPTIGQVASVLAMDRTTLTASLKPLERQGWIQTAVNPADKRGKLIRLTNTGVDRLAQALPIWMQTHAEVESRLGLDVVGLLNGLKAISERG